MNISIQILLFAVLFGITAPGRKSTVKTVANPPNIILILSDDIGYSDIGCYGGEIQTPNLDYLASEGVRFSQFYNGARCCPTRASLLTGLYPHQAGVGFMTGALGNTDAYQGHLKKEVKTVADYLGEAGYTTLHVGKWHVGNRSNQTLPLDKGFDKSWSGEGKVNYWNTSQVYENGISRPAKPGERRYLTDVQGDKAVEWVEEAVKQKTPFFMYMAFNAAHWPLHAKDRDIKKYRGSYRAGWEKIRSKRIDRLEAIGMIEKIDPGLTRDPSVPTWHSIALGNKYDGYHAVTSGQHDQDDWDLKMSVYAAQIDCMDQNIGKIVAKLKALEQYENTIIIYLQDNGACAEGIGKNDPEKPGTPGSYIAYGLPWANLSNTPFKMYKHFVHEGGISTPFIFSWPSQLPAEKKGTIHKQSYGHLIDVIPTCLDAAGVYDHQSYRSLEGKSLLPVIKGEESRRDRAIFWEHEGNRAIRKGDWKLLSRYKNDYRYFKAWGWEKEPREQEWELYNIKKDRWELNDLSGEYPEVVKELKNEYYQWYRKVGAIPREQVIKGSKHKF